MAGQSRFEKSDAIAHGFKPGGAQLLVMSPGCSLAGFAVASLLRPSRTSRECTRSSAAAAVSDKALGSDIRDGPRADCQLNRHRPDDPLLPEDFWADTIT
jgi:hypothetical protein